LGSDSALEGVRAASSAYTEAFGRSFRTDHLLPSGIMNLPGLPAFRRAIQWDTMGPALVNVSLSGLLLTVLGLYVAFAYDWSEVPGYGDFIAFHGPAKRLIEGGDIYAVVPVSDFPHLDRGIPGRDHLHPNLNPPFQTVLLAPLGLLEYRTALMVWVLVSMLCGTAGAYLLGAGMAEGGSRFRAGVLWAAVLFLYYPTLISLLYGQWALVPFFLLVLAWLAWRDERMTVAGGILGGLAAVKLFFGAFLLLLLFRRAWRGVASFVVVGAMCTAASVAVAGFDSLIRYGSIIAGVDWYSGSWNASFLGYFSRIFGGGEGVPLIQAPVLGRTLTYAFSVLALGSLMFVPRLQAERTKRRLAGDLAFAMAIPVMLLVSPFGWQYYFSFLLIPFVVLWNGTREIGNRMVILVLLVVAWLLGTVPTALTPAWQLDGDPGIAFWWGGTYFYSLLLFWALTWKMQRMLHAKGSTG
jgi:alpha-1,2-mannosyltransferase